jgi:hypothetical protein
VLGASGRSCEADEDVLFAGVALCGVAVCVAGDCANAAGHRLASRKSKRKFIDKTSPKQLQQIGYRSGPFEAKLKPPP